MKVQVDLEELLELQARVKELEEENRHLIDDLFKAENQIEGLEDRINSTCEMIKQSSNVTITDTKGNKNNFPDTDYTMD